MWESRTRLKRRFAVMSRSSLRNAHGKLFVQKTQRLATPAERFALLGCLRDTACHLKWGIECPLWPILRVARNTSKWIVSGRPVAGAESRINPAPMIGRHNATRQDRPAKSEVNPPRKQRKPLWGSAAWRRRSTKFGGDPRLFDRLVQRWLDRRRQLSQIPVLGGDRLGG